MSRNIANFCFLVVFLILTGTACGEKQQTTEIPQQTTTVVPTEESRTAKQITEESRTAKQILEDFTEEQCIEFLKKQGIELPEGTPEENAFLREFFYSEFRRVMSDPDYIPVFGREDLMIYSVKIKKAILTELEDEIGLARLEEELGHILSAEKRKAEKAAMKEFDEAQCIAFLQENGIEPPNEDQEYWKQFFYTVFRSALSCIEQERPYQPAYPKREHMEYAVAIARLVFNEIGVEQQIAEFEAFAESKLSQYTETTAEFK